eukprot:GGOE01005944.1.p1 GENE.GGOE01005944.1~~GGOE01005944.1.p1  ORF type:complete len:735 (+),score=140.18 GGOE01005944.1:55-2205(+)
MPHAKLISRCSPFVYINKKLHSFLSCTKEDADLYDKKVVVFVVSVATAIYGLTLGSLFISLGASLSSAFSFTMSGVCLASILHMWYTKDAWLARSLSGLSLCLCTAAVHWSFSGQSAGVLNWSFLSPLVVVYAGGSVAEGFILFTALTLFCISLAVASQFVAVQSLSPQGEALPTDGIRALSTANQVLPWLLSFLMAVFLLHRLRGHWRLLRSLSKAQRIAQMIIDFDLDAIAKEEPDEDTNVVLELLRQVACNLKLYQPFIPAHLLSPAALEREVDDRPETTQVPTFDGLLPHVADAASDHITHDDTPTLLGKGCRSPPGSGSLRAPNRTLDLPHQVRCGTLLYIELHDLEAYSVHSRSASKLERIHRAATTFAEVVASAIRDSQGVVQLIQHNACLISWNFVAASRLHAANACRVAIAVRDELLAVNSPTTAHPDLAPMSISMAVWTGLMVCGSFGTEGLKRSSSLGRGLSRTQELQQYAAAHRHTIVVNTEAQRHLSLNGRFRLVPVDVLSTRPPLHLDLVDAFDVVGAEIIYELVEEVQVQHDEWMYELDCIEKSGGVDKILEGLLQEAQEGVRDVLGFQRRLDALVPHQNQVVADVAIRLTTLLQRGTLSRPYRLQLTQKWCAGEVQPSSLRKSLFSPLSKRGSMSPAFSYASSLASDPVLPFRTSLEHRHSLGTTVSSRSSRRQSSLGRHPSLGSHLAPPANDGCSDTAS